MDFPILSGKADIANVRLEFESGCVANFTASRVSTERVRKIRFFQPRQYISLDYSRQDVLVFSVGRRKDAGNAFGQSADQGRQAADRGGRTSSGRARSFLACRADAFNPWSRSKTVGAPSPSPWT